MYIYIYIHTRGVEHCRNGPDNHAEMPALSTKNGAKKILPGGRSLSTGHQHLGKPLWMSAACSAGCSVALSNELSWLQWRVQNRCHCSSGTCQWTFTSANSGVQDFAPIAVGRRGRTVELDSATADLRSSESSSTMLDVVIKLSD